MTVTAEYLAQHLNDVLAALSCGEAVQVERPGGTVLHLTGSEVPPSLVAESRPRILGAGEGEMQPMSYEEWEQIDREWKLEFADKFGE